MLLYRVGLKFIQHVIFVEVTLSDIKCRIYMKLTLFSSFRSHSCSEIRRIWEKLKFIL